MSEEDFMYDIAARKEAEEALLKDMYDYLYRAALLQDLQRMEDSDTYNKFNDVLIDNLEDLLA